MSEETKKTETGSKIMSFHISEEEMQDPKLDQFVRESLIREADELERKLNSRPDLAGIEAPEGMFQSIVEELKRRGLWEEDETAGIAESAAEGSDGATGRESAETEDFGGAAGLESISEGSSDNAAEQKSISKAGTGNMDSAAGKADDGKIDVAQETENAQETDIVQRTEKVQEADTESLETLYAQLPEEDREALALGKEIAQKREKKVEKHRRRRKVLKGSAIVAACLAVIFGASMTSGANRRLVKKFWDGLMVDFGFRLNTNYAGEGDFIRSISVEEQEAMEEIHEKTGAPIIVFGYLPEGMEYQGYEITEGFDTLLFFSYQGKIFNVTMLDMSIKGAHYFMCDKETIFRETLTSNIGIESEIWETNLDTNKETYIAEIEYGGWRYTLNGMIQLEEMRNIIKNILFL